tara:strand:+ start:14495 stop:14893 length:399 start_codon:yes stop_codon:yes gene_type:complete
MNLPQNKLPSNFKFGLFFSFIFIAVSLYFFLDGFEIGTIIFLMLSLILLIVSFVKPKILLPFNKAWMHFGLFLGSIVNPIIFGLIFFGLFSSFAIIMRLFGRDHLNLKFQKKETHWADSDENSLPSSFNKQF